MLILVFGFKHDGSPFLGHIAQVAVSYNRTIIELQALTLYFSFTCAQEIQRLRTLQSARANRIKSLFISLNDLDVLNVHARLDKGSLP